MTRKETHIMTHTHPTTPQDHEALYLRLTLEAAALKHLIARHEDLKTTIGKTFNPGDKRTIKNAQGVTLATVSKTEPNKKAVCNDTNILLAMANDRGLEIVDSLPAPDSDKGRQILELLEEHAPHLLDSAVTEADQKILAAEVLKKWQITGELPTGWEIKQASNPRFGVSLGRTSTAQAATAHMLTQIDDVLALETKTNQEEAQS